MKELLGILEAENKKSGSRPRPTRQVQALLFDAGDILYHRPHGDRNFRAFLAEAGITGKEITEGEKKKIRALAFEGLISQGDYRKAILQMHGITDKALVESGSRAVESDENGIHFFKGVRQTLKTLKNKGYMLGIITDTACPIHVKLNWFERGGIGHVWDSIISSQEIGTEKPDPRIYSAALKQLGVSAAHAVFVGHNPEELEGARAVGMKTVAFNHDETARADYFITRFSDLLAVPVISSNNCKSRN
jgi:HAD superfamily hydrolase (TIGR01509 family)